MSRWLLEYLMRVWCYKRGMLRGAGEVPPEGETFADRINRHHAWHRGQAHSVCFVTPMKER